MKFFDRQHKGSRKRSQRKLPAAARVAQFEILEERHVLATLLASWQFNELATAVSVADSSGNNKHLNLNGIGTSDWTGPAIVDVAQSRALRFDSSTKFGSANSVSTSTADSISLWIKPNTTIGPGTTARVAAEFGSTNDLSGTIIGFGEWSSGMTNESIVLTNQTTWNSTIVSNVTLPAGRWSHLGIVWSDADNRYNVFIDGQVQTVTHNGGHIGKISVDNTTRIGQRTYPSDKVPLYGTLDAIQVYSGSLTTAEVGALANPPPLATATLAAEWAFNDATSNTSSPDTSGHGFNLTLNGIDSSEWKEPSTVVSPDTNSLSFTTTADFATVSGLPASRIDSISFWVNPNSAISPESTTRIVGEIGSVDNFSGTVIAFGAWTSGLSGETLSLIEQPAGNMTAVTGVTLPAGQWAHFAISWNTSANRYDIYINGTLQSVSSVNNHVGRMSARANTRLGQRTYAGSEVPLVGTLDEFRMYSGSLTADQIKEQTLPIDAVALLDATTFSNQPEFSTTSASVYAFGDQFIPVNTSRSYELRAWARSGDGNGGQYNAANKQYIAVASYDADQNLIQSYLVTKYAGSAAAHLTRPLNPGDTSVYIDTSTGWYTGSSGYSKVLAVYGYSNSANETYPDYTYTRHILHDNANGAWSSIDPVENSTEKKIVLRLPWSGPAKVVGTAVQNNIFAASYNYVAANNVTVPQRWTAYRGTIGGVQTNGVADAFKFRPGTAFIKPLLMANLASPSGNLVKFRDVEWTYAPGHTFHAGESVDIHLNVSPQISNPTSYSWSRLAGPYLTIGSATAITANMTVEDRLNVYTSTLAASVVSSGTTYVDKLDLGVTPTRDYGRSFGRLRIQIDATTFGDAISQISTTEPYITIFGDEFIPTDPYRIYELEGAAKAGGWNGATYSPNNSQYLGIASYDQDKNLIESYHAIAFPGAAPARLTQPLNYGDTVVHLDTVTGWNNSGSGYDRVLAIFNYRPLVGPAYPDYTYTRRVVQDGANGAWDAGSVDPVAKTITLRHPYEGEYAPEGTAAQNNMFSNTFNYVAANGVAVPSQWTKYEGTFGGHFTSDPTDQTGLRYGTAFIRPVILRNWHGGSHEIQWAGVKIQHGTTDRYFSEDSLEISYDGIPYHRYMKYEWSATAYNQPEFVWWNGRRARMQIPYGALDNRIDVTVTATDYDTSVSKTFRLYAHCDEETSHGIKILRDYDPVTFDDELLRRSLDNVRDAKAKMLEAAPPEDSNEFNTEICKSFDWESILAGGDGEANVEPDLKSLYSSDREVASVPSENNLKVLPSSLQPDLPAQVGVADPIATISRLVRSGSAATNSYIESSSQTNDTYGTMKGGTRAEGEHPNDCFDIFPPGGITAEGGVGVEFTVSLLSHCDQPDTYYLRWGKNQVDESGNLVGSTADDDDYSVYIGGQSEPINGTEWLITEPLFHVLVTANIDENVEPDEIVQFNTWINGGQHLDFGVPVIIEDVDETGELFNPQVKIYADGRPDPENECSCSCTVCAAENISLEPQDGSFKIPLSGSAPFLPQFVSAGTHSAQPILRVRSKLPSPIPASLTLELFNAANNALISSSSFSTTGLSLQANDEVYMVVQPNLAQHLTSDLQLARIRTTVNGSPIATATQTSLMVGDRFGSNHTNMTGLPPGFAFPFLKRVLSNVDYFNAVGELIQGGSIVFRGDDSASFHDSSGKALESLSILSGNSTIGFTLTHPHGDKDTFDGTGRHMKYVDPNGNETVFNYWQQTQQLLSVTEPTGRVTSFGYIDGQLRSITDFSQRVTTLSYDNFTGVFRIVYPTPSQGAYRLVEEFQINGGQLTTYTRGAALTGSDPLDSRTVMAAGPMPRSSAIAICMVRVST